MDGQKKAFALDTNQMEWEKKWSDFNKKDFFNKYLVSDEDADIKVKLMIYPKGFNTRWHTHPCAHGIYVLRGKLKTDQGVYGPGAFIWFPKGALAEHGSTQDEDVEVLFIANKAFDIYFEDRGGL